MTQEVENQMWGRRRLNRQLTDVGLLTLIQLPPQPRSRICPLVSHPTFGSPHHPANFDLSQPPEITVNNDIRGL